jgi:mRNA-degrading endonuclease RelE of RelBE toxin-antitoxin system
MSIDVVQSSLFSRQKKKLHRNQIRILDEEIRKIIEDPKIGEQKKGDLKEIWVHKFKSASQLFLLAYQWDSKKRYLIAIHPHENFYRDLKKYLK